ncbi:DUF1657 domain-containing protein [Bacillus suaedaesalsae]|uniref:DUF1657 domain-containing protein n=1 Tax=Bacillus suaedaesalsae TaxID=2810349 RepID=A0ABS2DM52_9BACI|nr:DUF1657 domain-containing protein [Bacillus suaedaesalsae]MBM6619533.1 DUF1657 domain-containing protein [Bacillus suaedaesalsae]
MTVGSEIAQLLATIKGIESQLTIFALNSVNPEAQKAFHDAMLKIGEIKNEIQNRKYEVEIEEPQYKK